MTEQPETPDPIVRVARDLREIRDFALQLPDQALHKASHRLMPGGLAAVMRGHVSSLEAWEHRIETLERLHYAACDRDDHHDCRIAEHVDDQDDHWETPLQTLLFWSEQYRVEHGREMDGRPNAATEATFLSHILDWVWRYEPHWDDFAQEVNNARVRMENELRAGSRAVRTQVPCVNPGCDRRPRLVKVYAEQAADDHFRCTSCKHRYDEDAYKRAYAKHLRSEGADRYVKVADARATLRDLGRSERTVRKWFEDGLVGGYCDAVTREVWCWWPDLWHLHLTTQTRRREVA